MLSVRISLHLRKKKHIKERISNVQVKHHVTIYGRLRSLSQTKEIMNTPNVQLYKPNLKLRHFKRYVIAAGSSIRQIQKKTKCIRERE